MLFFTRKAREKETLLIDEKAKDISRESEEKVHQAKEETDKFINAVRNGDITMKIWLATGGDRRTK